eukprot:CAMPEP_0113684976 /NCGR_PEP_ID=MMETSP0038_2-20120614/14363_1 /TAXON_ID=2898 /ORGANISM="Cryptomonas paramecium" /LENGTH=287 /DNA_ID=CAMNT_0000604907 /DNA_START=70 /DNA_END=930 /DNA_ORIENTATION=+ /assembly_acc=CAM_ASM_000170
MSDEVDLSLLGLEPGKIVWGQLGKNWWPARVAWVEKAPEAVRKASKTDNILIHWFDDWVEYSKKADKWAYGWLPASKIKDFIGSFEQLSKGKKPKIFLDAVYAALALMPDFKPTGWSREEREQVEEEEKKRRQAQQEQKRKPQEDGNDSPRPQTTKEQKAPLTERQQLKLLGVHIGSDNSDSDGAHSEASEADNAEPVRAPPSTSKKRPADASPKPAPVPAAKAKSKKKAPAKKRAAGGEAAGERPSKKKKKAAGGGAKESLTIPEPIMDVTDEEVSASGSSEDEAP